MASTNFTNAVTLTDAGWFNDVDTASYSYLTSVAGTNTITATGPVSMSAYAAGQIFRFIPAATNTGATTLNISSLGAKNVYFNGAALIGGEIRASVPVQVMYDGTQFNLMTNNGRGSVLLSSSTASSSAQLSALLPSTYTEFDFIANAIIPATDNTELRLQYSTDGGSTWVSTSSYASLDIAQTTAAATPSGSTSTTTYLLLANAASNTASRGVRVTGTICTAGSNPIDYNSTWLLTGDVNFASRTGNCNAAISLPTAFRIYMSSGNIASGSLRVWGRRK